MEIRFVDSPEFHGPDAETLCMVPLPIPRRSDRPDADELSRLLAFEPLTWEDQRACFRMMNYLKFKAARTTDHSERERLLSEAMKVRTVIALTSQRMIPRAAKRRFRRATSPEQKLAIMSDGNVGLMKAIDAFDYHQTGRFSSYAWTAIQRGDSSQQHRDKKWRGARQFSEFDDEEGGSAMDYVESREPLPPMVCIDHERAAESRRCMTKVHKSSREVVKAYFGIDCERQTLDEIGARRSLSVSRIGQIINRELERIRTTVQSSLL